MRSGRVLVGIAGLLLLAIAVRGLPGVSRSGESREAAPKNTTVALAQNRQPMSGGQSSDKMLAQSILDQLLVVAHTNRTGEYASWPPQLDVIPSQSSDTRFEGVGKYNAFATAENCMPRIGITDGLLHDVVENDPDRLSLVLGHELSHILLGHTKCEPPGATPSFLRVTFTRDQEYAADKNGLILMQRAGYSAHQGLKVFQVMDEKLGYSSFEALRTDHPSFKDRLAALDKDQAPLWQSMSAFETGVFFLAVEQYAPAEDCFTSVVKAYPDAAEAWLNLGYSRLMRYADAMTAQDVERLGFERVVAGGFFRRPDTLAAKVRGVDAELWGQAVFALQRAAAQKGDSQIVREALGIAYLISPQGPQADRAIPALQEALRLQSSEKSTDPVALASIKINLAVAQEAAGNHQESRDLLESAQRDCEALRKGSAALYFDETAILYDYAFSLGLAPEQGKAPEAMEMLEQYLSLEDPSSAWWPIAYKRYQLLGDKFQIARKSAEEIERMVTIPNRPVVSLDLDKKSHLTIGQPMAAVPARMGTGVQLSVDSGSGLKRVRYPSAGIELIGNTQLLAISLTDATAPPVQIKRFGTTAKSENVRVGMDLQSLRQILGKEPVAQVPFMDLKQPYYFFPYLGIGIRISEDAQISEILIAQIPVSQ